MRNDTKQFLYEKGLYPAEERNKKSLEELCDLIKKFEEDLNEERQWSEEHYLKTGKYDETKSEILRESIKYLAFITKRKVKAFQSNYGKDRYGPIPVR